MSRTHRFLLAWLPSLVLLLAAAPPAAFAADPAAETWYAQRLTTGDAPVRVDNLWSKGSWLRSETVIAGVPVITIVTSDRYMTIDGLHGRGVSIRRSASARAADATRGRPFGNEAARLEEAGAERVRTERLGPRECDVHRLSNAEGRSEICVTTDAARLPLQIEFFSRAGGQSVMLRYLDWTRGVELPDAFFAPDPRFELEPIEYEDYVKRSKSGPVGPAPPLFSELLHGTRN